MGAAVPTQRALDAKRPTGMRPALLPLALVVVVLGCAQPMPTTPSAPTRSAVASPAADDLLLRYGCERGPVGEPSDRACWGPTFSLYGDGRAIFRDATAGVRVGTDPYDLTYPAYRTVVIPLDAATALWDQGRQELGMLVEATAPPPPTPPILYGDPAWWERFSIDVDGRLVELAPGQGPIPPEGVEYDVAAPVRRLEAWAPPADVKASVRRYAPDRYCAWLSPLDRPAERAWPWPDLLPSTFETQPDSASVAHELTPVQARAIDPAPAGGRKSVTVSAPDGRATYLLAYRALMPDEACMPSGI